MDLLALTMAQVLIQILVAGIENRRIPDLDSELPVQFPIGFHAGPVPVKETMDVLIGSCSIGETGGIFMPLPLK